MTGWDRDSGQMWVRLGFRSTCPGFRSTFRASDSAFKVRSFSRTFDFSKASVSKLFQDFRSAFQGFRFHFPGVLRFKDYALSFFRASVPAFRTSVHEAIVPFSRSVSTFQTSIHVSRSGQTLGFRSFFRDFCSTFKDLR
ncbi:hypothetical protein AVEN_47061-1 [Araneus ventricosus]|uniref:Uncharacterized protein n=1 Tax=Araneus ventricosus TaxID=182803 RepID=A0A4Y2EYZ0_ARAVE|nr:hypothetical protein AVEN_47061-1 [Araneus ventricosus]